MKILILNGPNLNLQGRRDTDIYGTETFESCLERLRERYPAHSFDYRQSNIEGELIDALHAAPGRYDGVVLNAGGYTHTSVALRDAVSAVPTPSSRCTSPPSSPARSSATPPCWPPSPKGRSWVSGWTPTGWGSRR